MSTGSCAQCSFCAVLCAEWEHMCAWEKSKMEKDVRGAVYANGAFIGWITLTKT